MSKFFKPIYKKWQFPAGEVGVRVEEFILGQHMVLDFSEENDIMVWLQIIDAYNRHVPFWSHQVFIPYLPYGRQDKVHNNGEAVSLKIIFNLFKLMNCQIMTLDAHIPISDLPDTEEPVFNFFYNIPQELEFDFICFPDKNAIFHGLYYTYLDASPYKRKFYDNRIILDKKRNPEDGKLNITLPEIYRLKSYTLCSEREQKILLNDDICDGGQTFILAAKFLREASYVGKISLFVTHGIFSKGIEHLLYHGIDHIYTTNSYCKLKSSEKLTVFDIYEGKL